MGTNEQVVAPVKPDGSFLVFDQPEGTYEIVAEDPAGLVGMTSGELASGSYVLEKDVLLPEHGTVEGTVTDAGGSPLSGAPVHLWNANVLSRRSVSPDASGFFRFKRVAFGSFSLVYDGVPVPAQGVGALSALEELGETPEIISLTIIGTQVGGAVAPVSPTDEVVAVTLTPQRGLKFATKYRLTFSTDIVDTDLSPAGQPDPKPLNAETSTIEFETFRPAKLGEAPLQGTLVSMATLDNLAFVALQPPNADGSTGTLLTGCST